LAVMMAMTWIMFFSLVSVFVASSGATVS